LNYLVVSQDNINLFAYLSAQDLPDGTKVLTVPFAYQLAGASDTSVILLTDVFDPSGNLTSAAFYQSVGGAVGEVTPAAGSTLFPYIVYEDPAKGAVWQADGSGIDPNRTYSFAYQSLFEGIVAWGEVWV